MADRYVFHIAKSINISSFVTQKIIRENNNKENQQMSPVVYMINYAINYFKIDNYLL